MRKPQTLHAAAKSARFATKEQGGQTNGSAEEKGQDQDVGLIQVNHEVFQVGTRRTDDKRILARMI